MELKTFKVYLDSNIGYEVISLEVLFGEIGHPNKILMLLLGATFL